MEDPNTWVETWMGMTTRRGPVFVDLYFIPKKDLGNGWYRPQMANYDVRYLNGTHGEIKTIGMGTIEFAREFSMKKNYADHGVVVWTRIAPPHLAGETIVAIPRKPYDPNNPMGLEVQKVESESRKLNVTWTTELGCVVTPEALEELINGS